MFKSGLQSRQSRAQCRRQPTTQETTPTLYLVFGVNVSVVQLPVQHRKNLVCKKIISANASEKNPHLALVLAGDETYHSPQVA